MRQDNPGLKLTFCTNGQEKYVFAKKNLKSKKKYIEEKNKMYDI
jgi:hypothetical protein